MAKEIIKLSLSQEHWLKNLIKKYFPNVATETYSDYIKKIFIDTNFLRSVENAISDNRRIALPKHLQFINEQTGQTELELDFPALLGAQPFFSLINDRAYLDELSEMSLRTIGGQNIIFSISCYLLKKNIGINIINKIYYLEKKYNEYFMKKYNTNLIYNENVPDLFFTMLDKHTNGIAEYNQENNTFVINNTKNKTLNEIFYHQVNNDNYFKAYDLFALTVYNLRSFGLHIKSNATDNIILNKLFYEYFLNINDLMKLINNKIETYKKTHNVSSLKISYKGNTYYASDMFSAYNCIIQDKLETKAKKKEEIIREPKDLIENVELSCNKKTLIRYQIKMENGRKYDSLINSIHKCFVSFYNKIPSNSISENIKRILDNASSSEFPNIKIEAINNTMYEIFGTKENIKNKLGEDFISKITYFNFFINIGSSDGDTNNNDDEKKLNPLDSANTKSITGNQETLSIEDKFEKKELLVKKNKIRNNIKKVPPEESIDIFIKNFNIFLKNPKKIIEKIKNGGQIDYSIKLLFIYYITLRFSPLRNHDFNELQKKFLKKMKEYMEDITNKKYRKTHDSNVILSDIKVYEHERAINAFINFIIKYSPTPVNVINQYKMKKPINGYYNSMLIIYLRLHYTDYTEDEFENLRKVFNKKINKYLHNITTKEILNEIYTVQPIEKSIEIFTINFKLLSKYHNPLKKLIDSINKKESIENIQNKLFEYFKKLFCDKNKENINENKEIFIKNCRDVCIKLYNKKNKKEDK